MSEPVKNIPVRCPICGNEKEINVPESVFAQKKFGTIKINVPAGSVCGDHQFLVFVDTKGIIRGYEKIDMHLKTTEDELEKLSFKKLLRIYDRETILASFHAKLFNYPCFIVSGDKDDVFFVNYNRFTFTIRYF